MNSSQYPFTVFSINHYNQNLFWSTHDPHLRNQRQPGEKKSKAEKHWDLSLWCSSNLWSSRIGKFIMRSLTVTHRYNLQPLNTNPQLVTLLEGQINCMRLTIAYQKNEDNKALFWYTGWVETNDLCVLSHVRLCFWIVAWPHHLKLMCNLIASFLQEVESICQPGQCRRPRTCTLM